jgi:hypothetical protein
MKRIIRKYLGVASLLFASLMVGGFTSTEAVATTYNAGVLTSTPYTNIAFIRPGKSFTDTYNFSVATTGRMGVAASNIPLYGLYDITGFTMSIFDSTNNLISTGLAFSSILAAGDYHAVVSGLASGPSGGVYGFAAGAVGAVPEPETWGMIGIGIGMIGFQLRRRNKSSIKAKLS